ncbi:Ctr copper transporter [Ascobolus immersus RN42]|uniref:Copper transport protein n=1 Tax=Ascobolus immersus RN42 TaxID=1160509 RepID=A0A3N4J2P6_ASCIM|nr:Ctr copper transporter [Ascobolus immersus RN42]
MDHSHMDHSMHAGMGGGDSMEAEVYRCSMNMLFTWDTTNLCLVFRWWHITGPFSLVVSLLGVVVLSAGYEFLRALTRRYEARINAASAPNEESSLLGTGRDGLAPGVSARKGKLVKAVLYGAQVYYSFFIMLLFMTYNGWVMIAVAVGASLGYIVWGDTSAAKSVACH